MRRGLFLYSHQGGKAQHSQKLADGIPDAALSDAINEYDKAANGSILASPEVGQHSTRDDIREGHLGRALGARVG